MCLNSTHYTGVPCVLPTQVVTRQNNFPRNAKAESGVCGMPQAIVIKSDQVLLPVAQEGIRHCIFLAFFNSTAQLTVITCCGSQRGFRVQAPIHSRFPSKALTRVMSLSDCKCWDNSI